MKLRRATLSEDAYGAVRAILLDTKRFHPGDKVSIEELARNLGVSRSPVWSAVSRLEAEGLVNVSPRKGVFLVGFEPEKLRALFEVREALECMAARLAAERIAETELKIAAASITRQRAAFRNKDVAAYSLAALAFHQAIIEGARNPVMTRQLSAIYDQVHAICGGRLAKIGWSGRRLNIEDHAKLVEELRRGDVEAAEQVARVHARRLADGVLNTMAANPA
jgi:DNA-binding GntR family transcriptional regulator